MYIPPPFPFTLPSSLSSLHPSILFFNSTRLIYTTTQHKQSLQFTVYVHSPSPSPLPSLLPSPPSPPSIHPSIHPILQFLIYTTQDEAHIKRLERLSDAVVRLESFAGSDKEQNPLFKDYHGALNVRCKSLQ